MVGRDLFSIICKAELVYDVEDEAENNTDNRCQAHSCELYLSDLDKGAGQSSYKHDSR